MKFSKYVLVLLTAVSMAPMFAGCRSCNGSFCPRLPRIVILKQAQRCKKSQNCKKIARRAIIVRMATRKACWHKRCHRHHGCRHHRKSWCARSRRA